MFQILNFVLDVRLDYRVTAVLSTFKAEFETLGTQSSLADKEFSVINQRADELTKESIRLDLDHSGGKMFLRVIFLLILHHYLLQTLLNVDYLQQLHRCNFGLEYTQDHYSLYLVIMTKLHPNGKAI